MNAYLALILTASYYLVCLPLFTLFRWTLILVAPLYFALQFVLLPLVYLGRFSLQAALLPLTLLAKLEVDTPPSSLRDGSWGPSRLSSDVTVLDHLHLCGSCERHWHHSWMRTPRQH